MSTPKGRYNEHILAIMDRYNRGRASEEDLRELDRWYAQFPAGKSYFDGMDDFEKEVAQKRMLDGINGQIKEKLQAAESAKNRRKYYRSAAIGGGMLAFFFVTVLLWYERPDDTVRNHRELVGHQAILPGGSKAVLTLADGSRISLTDAAEGGVAEQAGVTVIKTADDQLIYQVGDTHAPSDVSDVFNQIETPRGGQYRIRLPDGTIVWLNTASVLKYPARFAVDRPRKVELSGEAYFEVVKDRARPFVVSCDGQDLEVLGTHFNLSAYPEDRSIITTLLEGSVRVSVASSRKEIILKPGQQLTNIGADLGVKTVNAEYAIAWKEGYFRFNGKDLEAAMKEIARWYDVTVHYKNPSLKRELLAGTISKYSNISQVLKKMELTGALRFSIDNREIIVGE